MFNIITLPWEQEQSEQEMSGQEQVEIFLGVAFWFWAD
jgi:hypothetical protein